MNIAIGNRLKKLRLDNGFSRKEVSNRLNIHETTLKRYEDGDIKKLSLETFKVLASFYNVEPYDIIGLENLTTNKSVSDKILQSPSATPQQPTNVVPLAHNNHEEDPRELIPVYGEVCAGDGIWALEDLLDEIYNPYPSFCGDAFALVVKGDSMNNVVDDGMYAIIQRQPMVDNGEIAVVLIDGDISMLKRFYRLDESTVVLKPDSRNSKHKTLIFENEEINQLYIIGKYIGCVSPMY